MGARAGAQRPGSLTATPMRGFTFPSRTPPDLLLGGAPSADNPCFARGPIRAVPRETPAEEGPAKGEIALW